LKGDKDVDSFGERLRRLRETKGLSVRQLAEMAEISPGFLSQIERSLAQPSIGTLRKIMDVLETSFANVLDDAPLYDTFLKKAQRKRLVHEENGHSIMITESLTPNPSLIMEPQLIVLKPKAATSPQEKRHRGEEFVYILSGNLTCQVQGKTFVLEEGDSLHIDSMTPHRYCNETDQGVELLLVNAVSR